MRKYFQHIISKIRKAIPLFGSKVKITANDHTTAVASVPTMAPVSEEQLIRNANFVIGVLKDNECLPYTNDLIRQLRKKTELLVLLKRNDQYGIPSNSYYKNKTKEEIKNIMVQLIKNVEISGKVNKNHLQAICESAGFKLKCPSPKQINKLNLKTI